MTGSQGGAPDLLTLQRDDELLDRLGARLAVESEDPAVRLLQALARDVDEELPETLPWVPDAPPVPTQRGRKSARLTAAALVLGTTLSVSGVAAAVTGDPFAPYRGIWNAVGDEGLPPNAARIAQFNKTLSTVARDLGRGDVSGLQERLADARVRLAELDLTPEQRAAFQRRLAALEQALAGRGPAGGLVPERARGQRGATPMPGDGSDARPGQGGGETSGEDGPRGDRAGQKAKPDTGRQGRTPEQTAAPQPQATGQPGTGGDGAGNVTTSDTAKSDTAKSDTAKSDTAKSDTAKSDKAKKATKPDRPTKAKKPDSSPASQPDSEPPPAETAGTTRTNR